MAANSNEEESSQLLMNDVANEESHDAQPSPNCSTVSFSFTSCRQFMGLRVLLRILSLWCPRSSSCLEKSVYPLLVNLLLLALVVSFLFGEIFAQIYFTYSDGDEHWSFSKLEIRYTTIYGITSLGACWCHIAGIRYFRSRDVEDNMINITLDGPLVEIFRKQLVRYNIRLILSTVAIPFFMIGTYFIWTQSLSYVFAPFRLVMIASHLYNLGTYVSLLWVIDLLQLVSNIRLKDQYQRFNNWTLGVEEGIDNHVLNYSEKVELTCRRLRIWFFIHNVSLIISLPAFVFSDAKLLLHQNGPFIFIGFAILLLIAWGLPLYYAERIQNHDEEFCYNMNKISLSTLTLNRRTNETAVQINTVANNEDSGQSVTFASRAELNKMVVFLKNMKSGFLSVGFTFQLRLSQISALISLLVLAIHLLET